MSEILITTLATLTALAVEVAIVVHLIGSGPFGS